MKKKMIFLFLVVSIIIIGYNNAQSSSAKGNTVKNVFEDSKVQPMVTAGWAFSVILKDDGTVWSCGYNENGQLGIGKTSFSSKPTRVYGLSDIIAVDSADAYSLALKNDGTVWGWGDNDEFELGIGKVTPCLYASMIAGIKDVKAIAAGNGMSVFTKKDGTVWYIRGENDKPLKPKKLNGLSDIIAVAAKHTFAIALKKDGTVYTWNWEYTASGIDISKPRKQKGISNVKSVSAGDLHYMAVKKDNTVWVWGENYQGQIGDGSINNVRNTPIQMKGIKNVIAFGAGTYNSMAATDDGTCWAWGDNEYGQYGNGSKKASLIPTKISMLTNVISIDSSRINTVALKSNGEVVVIGSNKDGVLGTGDKKDKLTPYTIMNLTDETKKDISIYPNGSLEDWDDAEPIAYGKASAEGEPFAGIKALYAMKDSKYLYLAVKLTKGIPVFVNFNLDFNRDQIEDYVFMFDTCYNNSENASLFRFQRKGNSSKRIEDGYGAYGDVVEIKVSLEELGNPETIDITASLNEEMRKDKITAEVREWQEVPDR